MVSFIFWTLANPRQIPESADLLCWDTFSCLMNQVKEEHTTGQYHPQEAGGVETAASCQPLLIIEPTTAADCLLSAWHASLVKVDHWLTDKLLFVWFMLRLFAPWGENPWLSWFFWSRVYRSPKVWITLISIYLLNISYLSEVYLFSHRFSWKYHSNLRESTLNLCFKVRRMTRETYSY